MALYPSDTYPEICEISQLANRFLEEGYELYMVGGAVRDMVLKRGVKDFDFTTNATPEQVIKLFRRVLPTGIDHGTVTVLLGAYQFEVTTYRIEGKYSDQRHPDGVSYAGQIADDLGRRDFTVNAMALNMKSGELVDLFGGQTDLQRGVLRAIGEPATRFAEDPLRVLRGCRFTSQLHLSLEAKTEIAMKQQSIGMISVERIKDELEKTLKTEKPSIGIAHMVVCGVLQEVFPVWNTPYSDTVDEIVSVYQWIDRIPEDNWLLRCVALFVHSLEGMSSIHEVEGGMKHLKTSKKEQTYVSHMYRSLYKVNAAQYSDGDLRKLIVSIKPIYLQDLFCLLPLVTPQNTDLYDELYKRMNQLLVDGFPLSIGELHISANELMSHFSKTPGPWLGSLLDQLFLLVLEDPSLNKKESLIAQSEALL